MRVHPWLGNGLKENNPLEKSSPPSLFVVLIFQMGYLLPLSRKFPDDSISIPINKNVVCVSPDNLAPTLKCVILWFIIQSNYGALRGILVPFRVHHTTYQLNKCSSCDWERLSEYFVGCLLFWTTVQINVEYRGLKPLKTQKKLGD